MAGRRYARNTLCDFVNETEMSTLLASGHALYDRGSL